MARHRGGERSCRAGPPEGFAAGICVVIRVLYVEDNDDNVYMLTLRLELLDEFEVLVAENGEIGCAKAAAEKPDLIIMDLELPVVDGWEATRRLKDNPATRDIPRSEEHTSEL